MPRITEEKHYDVVVVGGGMAGVCAAVAAARHGAKVAIVQNRSMYGGCASSEIKVHICGATCIASKKNLSEGGILLEILLANKARNPYQVYSIWDTVVWEKVHFQENLDSFLNTNMQDATVENGVIKSVTCYQNSTGKEFIFHAKIFVDATGDGTLGSFSGAISRKGAEARSEFNEPHAPEEANPYTMGNTLMFIAINRGEPVEFVKPFWANTYTEFDLRHRPHNTQITTQVDGGEFVDFVESDKLMPHFSNLDAGYWWVELGGAYEDIILDAEEIRDELLKCIYGVWDHIKNGGNHGAENYDLEWVGIVPGCRESVRIEGDYVLNENDLHDNRIFEDAVAYGGWPIDKHVAGGMDALDELPTYLINVEGCYTIPYRSYYSKNVPNLMMAGRDISASQLAFASSRVMGTCAIGGQAVGTAAALAIKYNCTPREVGQHINELQQLLLKDDCYIPGFANTDENDLARRAKVSASSFVAGSEPENIINGVSRTVDDTSNCWESQELGEAGESIALELAESSLLSQIRIVFDSNLTLDIMPSLLRNVQDRQVKGMPIELVSDYNVECIDSDGKVVFQKSVVNNTQRLNIIDLPEDVKCSEVKITVLKTHGYPAARIYEVRIY